MVLFSVGFYFQLLRESCHSFAVAVCLFLFCLCFSPVALKPCADCITCNAGVMWPRLRKECGCGCDIQVEDGSMDRWLMKKVLAVP